MSNYRGEKSSRPESDEELFEDLEDGAGCTEIWEHMSEERAAAVSDDD